MLCRWEDLPDVMRTPEVRPYWELLWQRRRQLAAKRCLDVAAAVLLLAALAVPMAVISLLVRIDSPGPAFFRQERVGACGRIFEIHKFRTMATDAPGKAGGLTLEGDERVTRVGARLRSLRLDELPQLIDVLEGTMSLVGTRPEVARYVARYEPVYYATLLLPPGITSEASIRFRDEGRLLRELGASMDVDTAYVEHVLPRKMDVNLRSLREVGVLSDALTILRTAAVVWGGGHRHDT